MKDKTIFLTFDMDWASDEVLDYLYELVWQYDLTGTLHITHRTDFIDKARTSGKFELGIHPNYNQLLNSGGGIEQKFDTVLREIKKIVPEAVCVRSHALTNSSLITYLYDEMGILYDLNTLVQPVSGMVLKPYEGCNGKYTVIPFIYEDDVWLTKGKKSVGFYLSDEFDAPRVFNFHPIHLYLNTDCTETYDNAKQYNRNFIKLSGLRNETKYGVLDFFLDLINICKNNGYVFRKIKDGKW